MNGSWPFACTFRPCTVILLKGWTEMSVTVTSAWIAALTRGRMMYLMKPELVTTRYATSSKTTSPTAIPATVCSRLRPFSMFSEAIVAIKHQV